MYSKSGYDKDVRVSIKRVINTSHELCLSAYGSSCRPRDSLSNNHIFNPDMGRINDSGYGAVKDTSKSLKLSTLKSKNNCMIALSIEPKDRILFEMQGTSCLPKIKLLVANCDSGIQRILDGDDVTIELSELNLEYRLCDISPKGSTGAKPSIWYSWNVADFHIPNCGSYIPPTYATSHMLTLALVEIVQETKIRILDHLNVCRVVFQKENNHENHENPNTESGDRPLFSKETDESSHESNRKSLEVVDKGQAKYPQNGISEFAFSFDMGLIEARGESFRNSLKKLLKWLKNLSTNAEKFLFAFTNFMNCAKELEFIHSSTKLVLGHALKLVYLEISKFLDDLKILIKDFSASCEEYVNSFSHKKREYEIAEKNLILEEEKCIYGGLTPRKFISITKNLSTLGKSFRSSQLDFLDFLINETGLILKRKFTTCVLLISKKAIDHMCPQNSRTENCRLKLNFEIVDLSKARGIIKNRINAWSAIKTKALNSEHGPRMLLDLSAITESGSVLHPVVMAKRVSTLDCPNSNIFVERFNLTDSCDQLLAKYFVDDDSWDTCDWDRTSKLYPHMKFHLQINKSHFPYKCGFLLVSKPQRTFGSINMQRIKMKVMWCVLNDDGMMEYIYKKGPKLVGKYNLSLCVAKELKGNSEDYVFELSFKNSLRKVYRTFNDKDLSGWIESFRILSEESIRKNNILCANSDCQTFEMLPQVSYYENGFSKLMCDIDPSNMYCADCTRENPDWGLINHGVLVCLSCSGVHRSFGTHISKVRSLTLDINSWNPYMIYLMLFLGNSNINSVIEYHLPEGKKPTPESSDETRAEYIKNKYVQLLYSKRLEDLNANTKLESPSKDSGFEDTNCVSNFEDDILRTSLMQINSTALRFMLMSIADCDIIGVVEAVTLGADVSNSEEGYESPLVCSLLSIYFESLDTYLLFGSEFVRILMEEKSIVKVLGHRKFFFKPLVICEYLIHNGADYQKKFRLGKFLKKLDKSIQESVQRAYPNCFDEENPCYITPLHLASIFLDLEVIVYFLEKGMDPTVHDSNGLEPIQLLNTIKCGDPNITKVSPEKIETMRSRCMEALKDLKTFKSHYMIPPDQDSH